jgi:hypothetical protein
MDLELLTVSSLTTEPDNLTALHQNSGLQTTHESRRTETGFLIREDRLPRCVTLPASNIPTRSWIWDQGVLLGYRDKHNEILRHWLCRTCYDSQVPYPLSTYLKNVEKNTNKALDHLQLVHGYDRKGVKQHQRMSKKAKQKRLDSWTEQSNANDSIFDVTGWKATYCEWVVSSGISLRQAASPEHNKLLCFQNPRIKDLVPQSHNTVASWVMAEYIRHRATIIRSIAKAKSKLTISFDGWKANNDVLDLLGVVVHYLGDDNKLHNVVLAMRDTLGSHTGANIADHLFDVLKEYQISGNQIAYFAADNATNNDTALAALSERVAIDPVASRLRCAGHIFNLVCTAILFSKPDKAALADSVLDFSQGSTQVDDSITSQKVKEVVDLEKVLQHGSEEEKYRAWQKHGPIGRLHNLVTHIKANNRRRTLFESKQAEANAESGDGETSHAKILRLVNNGGIRWNSTYLMIDRAIHLRDALSLYQDHPETGLDDGDLLSKNDWEELGYFRDLLKPIHEVSMRVQSVGTNAGALHNTLTSMDYLLHHLETRRSQPGTSYFMACLNVGWMKLRKYYQKTDLTPAYIMAVFLNPHYKYGWFEERWESVFVTAAKATIKAEFQAAERLHNIDAPVRTSTSPETRRTELSGFDAYNAVGSRKKRQQIHDELSRFADADPPTRGQDPLQWWLQNQGQYPVLKHLAFTSLAAPASTAADERLFSITGNVVNEERPHTQQPIAQSVQCLRSWHAEGLI